MSLSSNNGFFRYICLRHFQNKPNLWKEATVDCYQILMQSELEQLLAKRAWTGYTPASTAPENNLILTVIFMKFNDIFSILPDGFIDVCYTTK